MKCEHANCTKDASATVTYENPEGKVAYCDRCAGHHFSSDSRAVQVENGVHLDDD